MSTFTPADAAKVCEDVAQERRHEHARYEGNRQHGLSSACLHQALGSEACARAILAAAKQREAEQRQGAAAPPSRPAGVFVKEVEDLCRKLKDTLEDSEEDIENLGVFVRRHWRQIKAELRCVAPTPVEPPKCNICGEAFTRFHSPPMFANCWMHDCNGKNADARPVTKIDEAGRVLAGRMFIDPAELERLRAIERGCNAYLWTYKHLEDNDEDLNDLRRAFARAPVEPSKESEEDRMDRSCAAELEAQNAEKPSTSAAFQPNLTYGPVGRSEPLLDLAPSRAPLPSAEEWGVAVLNDWHASGDTMIDVAQRHVSPLLQHIKDAERECDELREALSLERAFRSDSVQLAIARSDVAARDGRCEALEGEADELREKLKEAEKVYSLERGWRIELEIELSRLRAAPVTPTSEALPPCPTCQTQAWQSSSSGYVWCKAADCEYSTSGLKRARTESEWRSLPRPSAVAAPAATGKKWRVHMRYDEIRAQFGGGTVRLPVENEVEIEFIEPVPETKEAKP